ncbi:hypothetical protein [Archangium sp.]|jgi:hypothetical protein|uniref:hypothetical protein n=1 Tax=Archangium sp. TaxID=1872627 RepID=UPI002ED9B579
MRNKLLLPLCLLLSACALFQRSFRPTHAPPEEAVQILFPLELPSEGRQIIRGPMAAAIQLAMDDFLPRDVQPHRGATPEEVCLYQRDSYDVFAAPGSEGVMLVNIVLSPQACKMNGPSLDAEATYAVDVRKWRILAIKR